MSNRMENDDSYWTDTKTRGFSFNDDDNDDTEDVTNPWIKDISNTTKLKLDLMRDEEVSSVYSGVSEASSEDDRLARQATDFLLSSGAGAPSFLLLDNANQNVDGIYRGSNSLVAAVLPTTTGFPAISKTDVSYNDLSGIGGLKHDPIREAILNFMLGQEVHLERFKSLADKKLLLSKALELSEGNAILAVMLFLQRTLRPSIFNQILMENPRAADHYVHYLEKKCDTAQLVDVLNLLGRTRDTLIIRYKTILRSEGNLNKLESQLTHFYKAECIISDAEIASFVKSHLNLIDTQKAIHNTGPGSSFNTPSSVMKTFSFLVEHYLDENTSSPLSATNFRTHHNLNDKQFAWINLLGLTKVQKWPQIESLLITKSWLGTSRDKCILPVDEVCNILKDAPVDLIAKFVRLIENAEKRLSVAKKFKCHTVVLDIFATQKDRAEIMSYRMKLDEKSKELIYADQLLKNTSTKWKN